MTDQGGDPACWAVRVCPACGRLDERPARDRDAVCPHCGADELDDDHHDDDDQATTGPATRPARRQLTDADYRRLLELRDGLRAFLHWSEAQARAAGITPAQHQLLLAVRGHPHGPPTVSEIADHLLLRHHSTVGLVDRAEAAGLVERHRDEHDHRVVRVVLTLRGSEMLAALTAEHAEELERIGLVYPDPGRDLPG